MNTSSYKCFSVLIAVFLMASQVAFTATTEEKVRGQITSIYDYSDFGLRGTFKTITNPATESVTRMYSNGSVTGHPGMLGGAINRNIFIPVSISLFYAHGGIKKTEDLVTKTVQEFDGAGKIKSSYTELDGVKYNAVINTATDGSYTIERKGKMTGEAGLELAGVFTTSKEYYDATGKLTKLDTYKLNTAEDDTEVGGKIEYTYDGPYLTKETTYLKNVDPITLLVTWKEVQRTVYAESRRQKVEKLKVEQANPADEQWFTMEEYIYEGTKLIKVQTWDETGKNTRNTFYDDFGRKYKIEDPTPAADGSARIRVLKEFFYNDTLDIVRSSSYDPAIPFVECVSAGMIKSIDYTYPEEGDYLASDITYYKNGDESKIGFGVHRSNPTGFASLTDSGAAYINPVVEGIITTEADGLVSITISNEDKFISFLNTLEEAIYRDENTIPGDRGDRATALISYRDSMIASWIKNGGTTPTRSEGAEVPYPKVTWVPTGATPGSIKLNVGAINLATISSPPQDQVKYLDVENEDLMKKIATADGRTVKLASNYWAVDTSGFIWVFVDSAYDEFGQPLP